jgi:hypothetical protein
MCRSLYVKIALDREDNCAFAYGDATAMRSGVAAVEESHVPDWN